MCALLVFVERSLCGTQIFLLRGDLFPADALLPGDLEDVHALQLDRPVLLVDALGLVLGDGGLDPVRYALLEVHLLAREPGEVPPVLVLEVELVALSGVSRAVAVAGGDLLRDGDAPVRPIVRVKGGREEERCPLLTSGGVGER